MTVATNDSAYIGVAPCGCVGAAHLMPGDDPTGFADWVRELVELGWRIEKVDISEVGVRLAMCTHDPKWGDPNYVEPSDDFEPYDAAQPTDSSSTDAPE